MIKNLHLSRWWFKPILPLLVLFTWLGASAQTFNFTTAGATGRLGPTQSQINTSYTSTTLNGKVTSNSGIQSWTVPANGKYTITAKGAQGATNGGKGATLSGEFNLLQGHVINIVVGQIGTGSGGAGGSFIFDATSSTLLMAAGGGGGGADNVNTQGQITTSASGGFATSVYNNNFAGKGGINGGGGGAGSASDNSTSGGNGGNGADGGNTVGNSSNAGAGGAGFLGKGGNSAGNAVQGGEKWANGMLGGVGPGNGGFGGGGASNSGSGGGGGYSGGGGGGWTGNWSGAYGGGGGSFNGGSNQVNSIGTNPGDGSVTIDKITQPNALSFAGPIDRVDVPVNSTVQGSFTVEAWLKPEDLSDMVIFSSRISNGNTFDIQFNSNGFHGDIGNGTNWLTTNADAPFTRVPGRWLHVAYVVTPTGYTIYGNGELIGNGNYSGVIPVLFNNGTNFQIGYNSFNQFTKGLIDELKIYNTALTQANVQADMVSTTASVPGNLIAYYSFDQGNAGGNNSTITTLNDDAGANYNGTLVNFTLNGNSSNWVGSYAMIIPTGLAATPVASKSFTANWSAPASGTINKYYLDVATDANFTNLVTGYNNLDVSNVLLYNVTGLNPNTNYYYRVRAYNTALNAQGASSKAVMVTTLKANQTLTFAATASKIYGDVDFTAGATSDNAGLPITYVSSDPTVATVTSSGTVHIVKAGTTTITASQAGNGTYNAATDKQQVLTISPKPITVTATAKTKVYGDLDPPLTYTLSSPLVTGDTFTGALGRAAGEAVGSYAINKNTLALSASYTLTFTAANLSITPKALLVTTGGVNKVYDGTTAATVVLGDNRLAGDVFNIGYTANFNTKDVGTGKTVSVTNIVLSGTDASNYTPNLTSTATADITPKIITINATAGQTKVYGDADPVLAYTTSAPLFAGDSFTGVLNRTLGNNIGNYTINQGSLTAGTNYALIYLGNNFSITTKPITVIADAKTKTYGDVDPELTYTLSTPLITGDAFTGALTRVTGENIGAYSINKGTLALSANYNLSYTAANLTIGQRALVITATGINKVYDGNTSATVNLTDNRVTGDDLTLAYANASFTDKNVAAGKPVSVNGITLAGTAAANYTFNTSANTVADINTKALLVTTSGVNKVYDGNATATVVLGDNRLTGDVFTVAYVANFNSKDVGIGKTVSVTNIVLNGTDALNYTSNLTSTATADITPKIITVNVTAGQTKIYGDADPVFTYTTSAPLISGDSFTGALSRVAGNNIGNYVINQGSLTAGANYSIIYVGNNFSITAKSIVVTADAKSKTYGDIDPALTYTLSTPLISGDAFTGALSRVAGEQVGAYQINKNSLALSSNYVLTYTAANLVINKKALIVSADNKTKLQGAANPALTVSYNGFIAGENASNLNTQPVLATTANVASLPGTYPITVGGAVSNNYAITYNNGTLTVQASVITDITLAATPLYENNAANAPAGTLSAVANDPAGTYTYTLVSGAGADDNAKFNISGNIVRATAALDFETQSIYSIRVKATSQFGVSFDRSLSITLLDVNEIPTLNAINNQTICYTSIAQTIALSGITAGPEVAQTTTISVTSNNAALFESLAVAKNGTTGTLTYKVKAGAAGTATVTVIVKDNGGTANGGVDTFVRTFTITVFELPVVTITSDKGTDVSKGETIKLTATGGVSYVWRADNSILAGQNTAVLTVRPSVNTTYTVTATNANGCTQTSSFTINVASDFAKLKITNLLTPNGDGFNDKWVIENIDLYPSNEVKVFDKAGRVVYTKKGYDNSWDGSFNGAPLKEDTYYYIVDFGSGFGRLKGFITIVREQ